MVAEISVVGPRAAKAVAEDHDGLGLFAFREVNADRQVSFALCVFERDVGVGRLEAGRDLEGIVLGLGEEQINCERHAGKDGDSGGLFSLEILILLTAMRSVSW